MPHYEAATLMVAFIGMFMTVIWIVRTITGAIQRKRELNTLAAFHDKLLDKFENGQQLKELMESDASDKLFRTLSEDRGTAHHRILSGLQAGAVLALLGLALFVLGTVYDFDHEMFTVFGVIALGLGAGFLLSSGISYRLSKKWGLIGGDGNGGRTRA